MYVARKFVGERNIKEDATSKERTLTGFNPEKHCMTMTGAALEAEQQ